MTIFVAEFTTNHLGNLNLALEMALAAKKAGADFIKMQKKSVGTFYSADKLNSPYKSPYGKTYYDYRKVFEFDRSQFQIFNDYCDSIDMPWFCTVQDKSSLDMMLDFDLPMYKIASSNARDWDFIRYVNDNVSKDKPIVLSVAGSTLSEIRRAVNILTGEVQRTVYVLHCVAKYPCNDENLALGNIKAMQEQFENRQHIKIGYSGHEEGIEPTLHVVDMGVTMIERHFCLSRHSFAHHIECSLEPKEFNKLVNYEKISNRKHLPDLAFDTSFGMSDAQRDFLVDQTYGKKFLGEESQWVA